MIIESRVTDIPRESQVSGNTRAVESRPESDASGLSESTGKPVTSQRISTSQVVQKFSEPVSKPIDVHEAVEKLNQFVRSQQRNITFSVDKESKSTVIKVFKTETGELIKQYPPEEILAMRAKLNKIVGWLVDSKY